MIRRNTLTASAAFVLLVFGGCSKDDEKTTEQPQSVAAKPELRGILENYEAIRELLVKDTGVGIAAHAKAIEAEAGKIAAANPAGGAYSEMAAAATKLTVADVQDLGYLRRTFGELSRPLVGLLERDPSLGAGLHTFECPMAKGYKRWLQPSAKLENPYMGQRMLSCGSEVE